MAPPVQVFPPSELTARIQYTVDGKRRKQPVKLEECKLMEMVQYMCDVEGDPKKDPKGKVVCWPVVRSFRRYVY